VQTGEHLGAAVVIQTDATDQELLVYLTHHGTGAPGLPLCHWRGHLKPRTTTVVNLQEKKDGNMKLAYKNPSHLNSAQYHFYGSKCSTSFPHEVPGTRVNKAV